MYHLAKSIYFWATAKEGISSPQSTKNTPLKLTSKRILHPPPRPRQRRQNHPPQHHQIPLLPLPPFLLLYLLISKTNRPNCWTECRYDIPAGYVSQDLGCRRAARAEEHVDELF